MEREAVAKLKAQSSKLKGSSKGQVSVVIEPAGVGAFRLELVLSFGL
jgi:hypothetical protein